MALNLGMQKKLWNKGFDGIVVGCGHENGAGVFRMHNLDTGKTHDTRNVRWLGKMHFDCAATEEESSMSDSTKNEKKEEAEMKTEEELSDGMAKATAVVDSEQSIEEQKSEDSSVEVDVFEEVGVRTRRQREEMGDDLRGGKGLGDN